MAVPHKERPFFLVFVFLLFFLTLKKKYMKNTFTILSTAILWLWVTTLLQAQPLCLPTITTFFVSTVGDSAILGGDIVNDGGSTVVLRGICYSETPNPNMGSLRTEDGSGIGSFTTVLRGLNLGTYYARSYAKNSQGVVVYGNELRFSTFSIGMSYAGGIIFDLDSTGEHGLICAPSDQGYFPWGCENTDIPNTSTAVGTGATNTASIMAGCSQRPIAASVCADLVLNGYSDWYLPSIGELQLMHSRLHLQGLGGFNNGWYWSSSQYDALGLGYGMLVVFGNGSVGGYNNSYGVGQARPVRAF
jgi:hypothetical protein